LDNFIEVFQRTLRVAKLHPGQVAIKIGMRIGWVLMNPSIHNLKIAPRIGAKKFVEHHYFFGCRGFFHDVHLRSNESSGTRAISTAAGKARIIIPRGMLCPSA
jgi:hypothetical protein